MDSGSTIERLSEAARALMSGDDRDVLRAAQAAQNALDAVKAEALHSLKRSNDFELDGASTVNTWARNELRLDATEARKLVAAASATRDLPAVAAAASEGRISLDHTAAFSYGLKHIDAEIVRESEGWLLDVALSCEPAALRTVMRELRVAVYPDSLDEAWAKGMDKQDFQVNPVPQGWHVNGFLNITTGAKLDRVLGALAAPQDKDDDRTGADRRVTALDDLLDSVLASGLPSDKGVRPHLSVIVDAETLHASANRLAGFNAPSATPASLAGFGPIGPKLLDYLGCISDVTGILTTGGELPQARILNVGRTHRAATLKQRRAIIARQGGECAAPGCRHTHLEIHHSVWWSHGGSTDLDQMVGLCVRCHHLLHRGLLHVTADGRGGFSFTNNDNRPLRQAYRERVAAHRETAIIRRVARDLRARRERPRASMRT
ncbi:MAG TPA: DUF222 domain-containing protein [Acidimicrobiia bacterium]|nr:DUF222 domain-containing protein [Acidimicrobiia bacterium]